MNIEQKRLNFHRLLCKELINHGNHRRGIPFIEEDTLLGMESLKNVIVKGVGGARIHIGNWDIDNMGDLADPQPMIDITINDSSNPNWDNVEPDKINVMKILGRTLKKAYYGESVEQQFYPMVYSVNTYRNHLINLFALRNGDRDTWRDYINNL